MLGGERDDAAASRHAREPARGRLSPPPPSSRIIGGSMALRSRARALLRGPEIPSPADRGAADHRPARGSGARPRTWSSGCGPATSRSSTTPTSTGSPPRTWPRAASRAVVNVARSSTGRYPNAGPLILARAGVPLVDVARRAAVRGASRRRPGRPSPAARSASQRSACSASGTRDRPRAARASRSSASASGSTRRSPPSPRTRSSTSARRASCSPGKLELPRGADRVPRPPRADRRPRHRPTASDLRTLRAYIEDTRPVLVGVDGGADAILEEGFKPDMILGDMDSATRRGAHAAAPSSSSTPTPTAARPGASGSRRSASSHWSSPRGRHQPGRGDAARPRERRRADRLASAPTSTSPSSSTRTAPGCRRPSSPGCGSARRWSTPRASAASTTRASAAGRWRLFLARLAAR